MRERERERESHKERETKRERQTDSRSQTLIKWKKGKKIQCLRILKL